MKEFNETRSPFPFLRRVNAWFRVKRLENDLHYSRSFQKRCEALNCPTLAALERDHQQTLLRKIDQAKNRAQTLSLPAPSTHKPTNT